MKVFVIFFLFSSSICVHAKLFGSNFNISVGGSILFKRREESELDFLLYTRKNPEVPQELITGDTATLSASNFDASKTTKVIVHGWKSKPADHDISKNNYLETNDYNVILADWENVAGNDLYFPSAAVTETNGILLGELICFLVENGANVTNFHLIGFSLGSHIVGSAGCSLKCGTVPRITGLDPASPGFENFEIFKPLNKSCANFVDVIHTSGGTAGFLNPLGHADFYPNCGTFPQPSCEKETQITEKVLCSHVRAHDYWAESIINCDGFLSKQCDFCFKFKYGLCPEDVVPMGECAPDTARGEFYLETNLQPPFAKGNNFEIRDMNDYLSNTINPNT